MLFLNAHGEKNLLVYSLSKTPSSDYKIPLNHLKTDFFDTWLIAMYQVTGGTIGVANPLAPRETVQYVRDFLNIAVVNSNPAEVKVYDPDLGKFQHLSGQINELGHFFHYEESSEGNDYFSAILPIDHHTLLSVNGRVVEDACIICALMSPLGEIKPVVKHIWELWNFGHRFVTINNPGFTDELFPGVRPSDIKQVGLLQFTYGQEDSITPEEQEN
jgi:hypothetical protein